MSLQVSFQSSRVADRFLGGRLSRRVVAATLVASLAVTMLPATLAQAAAPTWSSTIEIPGLATASSGNAVVNGVWCVSTGNCIAGGQYNDASGGQQAFVDNEVNGTWGSAVTLAASLNQGGGAAVTAVSCGGVSDCRAVGYYTDSSGNEQGFVVDDSQSIGTPVEVTGTVNLTDAQGDGFAELGDISCGASGVCAAGGLTTDLSMNQQAMVVDYKNGAWGTPQVVSGIAALNTGGFSFIDSISCTGAGDCTASGGYAVGTTQIVAFVVEETNGTWGSATAIPGFTTLAPTGLSLSGSVACSSPGNCSVGGDYVDSFNNTQAFLATEVNGTWGQAFKVAGLDALNVGNTAALGSIVCPANGECSAGGVYTDNVGVQQAFVVNETKGTWGSAQQVAGTESLDAPGASVTALACASAGNCLAGGHYATGPKQSQSFVVHEAGGVWGTAMIETDSAALNVGLASTVTAIGCSADGGCAVGGAYTDASALAQASVDNLNAPPITAPSQPQAVRVTPVAKGLKVSWHAPSSDGGSPITSYTAKVSPGGHSCTTTSLTCTVKGLNPKIHYSAVVTAKNVKGVSGASARSKAVKPK